MYLIYVYRYSYRYIMTFRTLNENDWKRTSQDKLLLRC